VESPLAHCDAYLSDDVACTAVGDHVLDQLQGRRQAQSALQQNAERSAKATGQTVLHDGSNQRRRHQNSLDRDLHRGQPDQQRQCERADRERDGQTHAVRGQPVGRRNYRERGSRCACSPSIVLNCGTTAPIINING